MIGPNQSKSKNPLDTKNSLDTDHIPFYEKSSQDIDSNDKMTGGLLTLGSDNQTALRSVQHWENEDKDNRPSEVPNIFFNSLTDKGDQQKYALDVSQDNNWDKIDPKSEEKLFRLMFRKKFRLKAYFLNKNRMMFESFLQNYIKNFEEQQSNEKIMIAMKKARLFIFWKESNNINRISKTQGKDAPAVESKQQTNPSSLNPQLEQEYMHLIEEFRKVSSLNLAKNITEGTQIVEKAYLKTTKTQTYLMKC